MDDKKDLCPISDNGNHRYFIFKAVEVFVPVDKEQVIQAPDLAGRKLYEKKSLVVSGCNCGAALTQEVPIV